MGMWFFPNRRGEWEVYARATAKEDDEVFVGAYNTHFEAVEAAKKYAKEHGLRSPVLTPDS